MNHRQLATQVGCNPAVISRMTNEVGSKKFRWPALELLFKIYDKMGHPIPGALTWREDIDAAIKQSGMSYNQASVAFGYKANSAAHKIVNARSKYVPSTQKYFEICKLLGLFDVQAHVITHKPRKTNHVQISNDTNTKSSTSTGRDSGGTVVQTNTGAPREDDGVGTSSGPRLSVPPEWGNLGAGTNPEADGASISGEPGSTSQSEGREVIEEGDVPAED